MASNVTVPSLLDKISKDHLECPICTLRFIDPTMLDCLHSFCFKCLKELHQQDPNNSILLCPLCRKKTTLRARGNKVDNLPKDFKLNALVVEVTDHERLMEGHSSKVKCQACDEGNEAVSRCMDCEHFFCCECQQAHQRLAFMKSHQVHTLAQLQANGITYKNQVEPLESANKYCKTCLKLARTTCTTPDQDSPKHDVIDVPEDLSKLVAEVKKHKEGIQTAMADARVARSKLEYAFIITESKITQKATQEFANITEEKMKLKQEVKRIYEDRVQMFETAEETYCKEKIKAEHKLDEVNQLIAQTSQNNFLDLKENLLPTLDELTKTEKAPTGLSFLDFEEDEGSFGRLVLKDEQSLAQDSLDEITEGPEKPCIKQDWGLKLRFYISNVCDTELYSVNSVTAFSKNEIIVTDIKQNYLIRFLIKYDGHCDTSNLTVNPQRLQITDLINPYRAVVNNSSQLIVLDRRAVKVSSRNHQLLHEFTPGARSGGWPSCLAVSHNDLIVVGYKNKAEISLHKPSGSLVKTLPAPDIGYYLTTYKQQFIYTNTFLGKLISVDYNGDVILSVDIKTGRPYGVCCDKDGNIFVVIAKTTTSDEVQHYSQDGKYIGRIIKDCGLLYDIAITTSGDIVAVTHDSVRIYCHT